MTVAEEIYYCNNMGEINEAGREGLERVEPEISEPLELFHDKNKE